MHRPTTLFSGQSVRLTAPTKTDFALMAKWTENADYLRHVDSDAVRPRSEEDIARDFVAPSSRSDYYFHMRTLEDDRLLGFIVLHSIEWKNSSAIKSMGIGDPNDWGKGYGSDAMQVILRYAFDELNLYRVGLDVNGDNTRAIRAYENAGFQHEGAMRGALYRDGERYDRLTMGILRSEWESMQG